jgi:nitroreductase
MPFDMIKNFGKEDKIEKTEDITQNVFCETLSSVIKKRRSVRKYLKKDVPNRDLEWIFDAARYTPSAGNYQPWEFIVVRNEDTKKDLVEACYGQKWMLDAPIFVIACVNLRLAAAVYGERGAKLYGIQAVAAATENMMLMAEALGLGSCWVGAFSEVMIARLLECPEYVRPCAIITLGYPDEEPRMPPRQSIQEFVHLERFGNTMQMRGVEEEKSPTYVKFV